MDIKEYSAYSKTQLKLMLQQLNMVENPELVAWVNLVNDHVETQKAMVRDYLEMGLKSCIMRQKRRVGKKMLDSALNIGLSLLDVAISLAAKRLEK